MLTDSDLSRLEALGLQRFWLLYSKQAHSVSLTADNDLILVCTHPAQVDALNTERQLLRQRAYRIMGADTVSVTLWGEEVWQDAADRAIAVSLDSNQEFEDYHMLPQRLKGRKQ